MTHYTNPLDIASVAFIKTLHIEPNTPYYHTSPMPTSRDRYKNFPHQPPVNAEQAENQGPNSYKDIMVTEVGNNFQYKTIIMRPRQPIPVILPKEQFNELENGIYFFTMDMGGILHRLNGAEEALQLNNYIRVEKEMGKIISIEKRPLIFYSKESFEYWPNGNVKQIKYVLFDINNLIIRTIYSDCDEDNGDIVYIKTLNKENNIIYVEKTVNEGDVDSVAEAFDNFGTKTNHIIIKKDNKVINQHLDKEGNILSITNLDYTAKRLPNFEEQEPYKSLPLQK